MFQESKAHQNVRKTNISYLLIRTRACAYQGVKNVCFSDILACFAFLKHPFWESPFCLIPDDLGTYLFLSYAYPLQRFRKFCFRHFWKLQLNFAVTFRVKDSKCQSIFSITNPYQVNFPSEIKTKVSEEGDAYSGPKRLPLKLTEKLWHSNVRNKIWRQSSMELVISLVLLHFTRLNWYGLFPAMWGTHNIAGKIRWYQLKIMNMLSN